VPVEAVRRDVQLAAAEPLRERRLGPVEDLVELLDPVELLGPRTPPRLRIAVGTLVDPRVGGVRLGGELRRRRKGLLGIEEDVESSVSSCCRLLLAHRASSVVAPDGLTLANQAPQLSGAGRVCRRSGG
jgi:hypothetical protein